MCVLIKKQRRMHMDFKTDIPGLFVTGPAENHRKKILEREEGENDGQDS